MFSVNKLNKCTENIKAMFSSFNFFEILRWIGSSLYFPDSFLHFLKDLENNKTKPQSDSS